MNKYELVAFVVAVTTMGVTLSTIARAWLLRGTGAPRRDDPRADAHVDPRANHGRDAAVEARLARIEHAIEAVAVEVERISENQRFTTRLLTDREAQLVGDGGVGAREANHAR